MRRLAGLVLVALVLAGCGSITEGRVVEREAVPARDWVEKVPDYISVPRLETRVTCQTVNKQQTCTTSSFTRWDRVLIGFHDEARHADPYWLLTVENAKGERGVVQVPERVFSEKQIGTYYDHDNPEKVSP